MLVNVTIPVADNGSLDRCEMNVGDNETVHCSEWEYFGDIGHTIVSQVNRAPAFT